MDIAQAKKNMAAADAAAKAAAEESSRAWSEVHAVENALREVTDETEAAALVGKLPALQNRHRVAREKAAAATEAQKAARLVLVEAERDEKRRAHEDLRARTVAALWTVHELAVELRTSDRTIQELDAAVGGYPAGQVPPNATLAQLVRGIETALVRMGAADHANGLETGPILRPKNQAPKQGTGIGAKVAAAMAAVVGG